MLTVAGRPNESLPEVAAVDSADDVTIEASALTASPGPNAFIGRIPSKLARCQTALLARFRPLLADHGLTDSQWRVLRVLSKTPDLDAGDTAKRAYLLPSSLTRIVRELNKRGLIAVRTPDEDTRRSILTMTAKGCDVVASIDPHLATIRADVARCVGLEDLILLSDLLDRLSEALERGSDSNGRA